MNVKCTVHRETQLCMYVCLDVGVYRVGDMRVCTVYICSVYVCSVMEVVCSVKYIQVCVL